MRNTSVRRVLKLIGLGLGTIVAARSQTTGFLERLSPAERERAGVGKLSPSEIHYLDELIVERSRANAPESSSKSQVPNDAAMVRPGTETSRPENLNKSSGMPEISPPNAAPMPTPRDLPRNIPPRNPPDLEEPSPTAIGKRAAESTSASEGAGWLNWLRPKNPKKAATPIIESQISGKLSGWNAHTIITLTNGQRWAVSDYSMRNFIHPLDSPKVTITPTSMFGYILEIPEADLQIRVRPAN